MEENLRDLLEEYVSKINTPDFIDKDPVQFPRRFTRQQDIEIAGFLTATIAWGKRAMILRDAERMLTLMDHSPYDYIMEGDFPDADSLHTIHRTFNSDDFAFLCRGLQTFYKKHSSMEELFIGNDMFDGIQLLRNQILDANNQPGHRAEKHVSSPSAGSACKRLHMFLRWMVRNDGIVDIGCWEKISASGLYIPLDVHVGNISRYFGMLMRKQNDRKSVVELTDILRSMDSSDPVKYDFALFGVGEAGLIELPDKKK